MPRRYIDYPAEFALWNWWSSVGAFISIGSFIFFIGLVIYALMAGRRAEANPWGEHADTLEWTLPSPPPEHTFDVLPDFRNKPAGH